ncbi:hypothetical protein SteCoe_28273 [Stentor coeruleus]|uniref:Trafficking protein particle complex subunit n=1 Tax=Stentor coeruleus TaxID=5963 RepID=A0A1R2B8P0_9CILI|nr:hypothetical protein SteCoe_28273 [Stentor coeruleus]
MKKSTLYDKNLRSKREVSDTAFYFLFSEIVQYCIKKDRNNLEKQLEELGYPLGGRFLELITFRDKSCKKEIEIEEMLISISKQMWPVMFGKHVSSLEQHTTLKHIYMIKEDNSVCNKFACLPKGQKGVNCSAFTAGIVEGMLNAAGFASRVYAVYDGDDKGDSCEKTTYVIHFAPEIVERKKLG